MADLGGRVLVEIHGYSPWWLHLLPARARARILAESIRQTYAGRMPPCGIDMRIVPDGTTWRLRDIMWQADDHVDELLPEPPAKTDLRDRVARLRVEGWLAGIRNAGILRAAAVLLAAVLPWSCASPFLRLAMWIDSWRNEIRLMLGRGRRWDVERGQSVPDLLIGMAVASVFLLIMTWLILDVIARWTE